MGGADSLAMALAPRSGIDHGCDVTGIPGPVHDHPVSSIYFDWDMSDMLIDFGDKYHHDTLWLCQIAIENDHL